MAQIALVIAAVVVLLVGIQLRTPPEFEEELKVYDEFSRKQTLLAGTVGAGSSTDLPFDAPDGSGQPEASGSTSVRVYDPAVFRAEGEGLLKLRSSPGGATVALLHYGEMVEVRYEVRQAGREWALVKVAGKNLTGFIENNSLKQP